MSDAVKLAKIAQCAPPMPNGFCKEPRPEWKPYMDSPKHRGEYDQLVNDWLAREHAAWALAYAKAIVAETDA